MSAVVAAREARRIPVLLGGSGVAGRPPVVHRKLPVLLRPLPCSGKCSVRMCASCHAGD